MDLNNVIVQEITFFRASKLVVGKSNSGSWNTISRLYYGGKIFIKSEEYTFIEKLIN